MGEFPESPLTPMDAFDVGWIAGLNRESAEAAIEGLVDLGIVVKRSDAHFGGESVGLRKLVEADEAPYEELKSRVYQKAKACGLSPKWRPGEGWRLVDGGGITEYVGPMQALEAYLDALPVKTQAA